MLNSLVNVTLTIGAPGVGKNGTVPQGAWTVFHPAIEAPNNQPGVQRFRNAAGMFGAVLNELPIQPRGGQRLLDFGARISRTQQTPLLPVAASYVGMARGFIMFVCDMQRGSQSATGIDGSGLNPNP